MTVLELRKALETLPDHMDVFVSERKTEFAFGLVNSAIVKRITFSEDVDSDPIGEADVLVLDEE